LVTFAKMQAFRISLTRRTKELNRYHYLQSSCNQYLE